MDHNPVLRLYFVRHGETNENRAGIVQGQMDTQLNRDGITQSHLCAERFQNTKLSAALCSDLKRTVTTAEIILKYHPNIALYKDASLRERDMGDLQGSRAGKYDRGKLPKNAETGQAFAIRIWTWWKAAIPILLLGSTENRTQSVLVVSHGAYIATLVRVLIAERVIRAAAPERHGPVYNTSVTTIDIDSQGMGVLLKYSDISHLALRTAQTTSVPTAPAVQENADEQVTHG